MAVRMPLRSRNRLGPKDEHPARPDHLRQLGTIDVKRYRVPGERGARIGRKLRACCRDCLFYAFDCLIPPDESIQPLDYRDLIRTLHRIHFLIPSRSYSSAFLFLPVVLTGRRKSAAPNLQPSAFNLQTCNHRHTRALNGAASWTGRLLRPASSRLMIEPTVRIPASIPSGAVVVKLSRSMFWRGAPA